VKASIDICTLVDYSVAKKHQDKHDRANEGWGATLPKTKIDARRKKIELPEAKMKTENRKDLRSGDTKSKW
jgi:hypothetical protein